MKKSTGPVRVRKASWARHGRGRSGSALQGEGFRHEFAEENVQVSDQAETITMAIPWA